MADAATATPTPEGGAPPEAKPQELQIEAAKPGEKAVEKPPEKKPEPRFYERKINGKLEKIPAEVIDAAAEVLGLAPSEIVSVSQLKRAAYERFEQAEKMRKEVEALKATKDPFKIAAIAGLDDAALDAAAEQRLIAKLQREAMDPEQRKLAEERDRLTKEREAIDKEKAEQAEKTLSAQATAIRERLEPMVIEAIEKVGLPKTPDAVRAVVDELQRQHKYGLPLDALQAASNARDQFFRPSVSMLRNMTAEAIVRELGKEKFEELLKFSLKKPEAAPAKPAEEAPAKPKTEKAYMTEREWRARFGT